MGNIQLKNGLKLNKNQEKFASVMIEHSTTYITMLQVNKNLEEAYGQQRLGDQSNGMNSALQISRLIRNAFAHDPFEPIWKITLKWDNQIFEIENVIKLDTTGLNGKSVERRIMEGKLHCYAYYNL